MGKPKHTGWDEHASAPANARRHLPRAVAEYFARARRILARNPPPPELHRLRLATKRLRYTLELFRPCYGPGLETRVAILRKVQGLLGDVNDSAVASRLITESMTASPDRDLVCRFLEERASAKARDFHKQWTEVFDAPGQERWWTTYLARHTRSPK